MLSRNAMESLDSSTTSTSSTIASRMGGSLRDLFSRKEKEQTRTGCDAKLFAHIEIVWLVVEAQHLSLGKSILWWYKNAMLMAVTLRKNHFT